MLMQDQETIDIYMGLTDGYIMTLKDYDEMNQKAVDRKTFTLEQMLEKYSPFRNPGLRLSYEQIESITLDTIDYNQKQLELRNLNYQLV
jgi:hypothetical protein